MSFEENTSADKWIENVKDTTPNILSRPFVNAKKLAVRHKLRSVTKNEKGNKVYTWDVYTVSDTIARGAAFRATQRTISRFGLFRDTAQTRIVSEETEGGGPLSVKKIVEVEVDPVSDNGWASSVEDAGDRWKDAFNNIT